MFWLVRVEKMMNCVDMQRERGRVIAEFMDAHPAIFIAPAEKGVCWVDIAHDGHLMREGDAAVIQKALNMFSSLLSDVQEELASASPEGAVSVSELVKKHSSTLGEMPPDAAAIEAIRQYFSDDDPEVEAFGRVVSLCKVWHEEGKFNAADMVKLFCRAIDEVPSRSDLTDDIKDALKQLSIIQFNEIFEAIRCH